MRSEKNMRKMKDSGIQWIGKIPEKERLEMRDKRKEDCFSKIILCQNRHCEASEKPRKSNNTPFCKGGSCEAAWGF